MSRDELEKKEFYGLGIAPTLLERIEALGFKHPTPIQFKAIPIACTGEDVVGIAQTGTGKTLAFSIPMLQQMAARGKKGLILLPTRELAIQVETTLEKLAGPLGLRTVLLIGGVNPNPQIKKLRLKPHVIIATPGRLIDMMQQKHARLDQIGVLVLDEADRMLDMGFAPQLKKILATVPSERQTMLFSATMPEQIASIARQYMKSPLRVEVAPAGTTAESVEQEMFIVPKNDKTELLKRLLTEYKGTILVFCRTKHGASKLARSIRGMGHSSAEIHSNRSQNQRQEALRGFTNGKYRVMVATDIAARGIDVKNIELVVNYDLPDQLEDYVHRIGRTGRAGSTGKAISFAAPEQKNDIIQIERLIKATLTVKTPEGELIERKDRAGSGGGSRSRSGGGGRGGRSGGGRPGRARTRGPSKRY
ncbi:DEAD/DEAH box helicase [Candidatus Uhrbacteria bacterium]|nr:DEAD/DEAH box helicase [Candidatus Uhrbacteria bacterium]